MTTIQTSLEPLPLDPATFNTMLRTTVEALPYPPGATAEQRAEKREAAFLAIAALHPRDPLEAMLAARIVTLHYHAMHHLACSIQPNIPGELQLRCEGRAMQLGKPVGHDASRLPQAPADRVGAPAGGPARLGRYQPRAPGAAAAQAAPAATPAGTASRRGLRNGGTAHGRGRAEARTRHAPGRRRPGGKARYGAPWRERRRAAERRRRPPRRGRARAVQRRGRCSRAGPCPRRMMTERPHTPVARRKDPIHL